MVEVRYLASGELAALLDPSEVEGHDTKWVKREIYEHIGASRFRQRLFHEDGREIPDNEIFTVLPNKLQLVVLDFWPPDVEEDMQLILATRNNELLRMDELLRSPRDPNQKDEKGYTPLLHAALEGDLGPVWLLIEAGADIDARNTELGGMGPMHLAAMSGHYHLVRFLVEYCPDHQPRAEGGLTPVHFAAKAGHLDVVQLLLSVEPTWDLPMADDGSTALHLASSEGYVDIVRVLLEAKADKDQATTDRLRTPLHFAAQNGHVDTVRLLFEAGVKREPKTAKGSTPLFLAACNKHFNVAAFLLVNGIDQNQPVL